MNMKTKFYFPGGNTTKGFYSYYNSILDNTDLKEIFTIKGGPGVGKSTLMKAIGKRFSEKGFEVNFYYCSSDPESLDGVLIPKAGVLFVDGTAPHIIDPKYPGVLYTLINLADFLDRDKLIINKNEITNLTDKITSTFNCGYKYLNSLIPIYENINSFYQKALIDQNFYALTNYLSEKIINNKKGKKFKETKLFLSAITPFGLKNVLNETVDAKNIYVLNSSIGDLSYKILEYLKRQFELNEFSIECYYCPVNPDSKIEHIIVPELDFAIITSNKYHKYGKGEIINTSPLYNLSKEDYSIIDYDLNIIDNMINRTTEILKTAKAAHDKLESYYIEAMDYKKLDKFTKKFIDSISV